MREPVITMKNRVLSVLESAGRNKRTITRKLNAFEAELKKETGEKQVRWTEEYYLYLLETYLLSMDPAIEESIEREEYEWADALTKRKLIVSEQVEDMDRKLA